MRFWKKFVRTIALILLLYTSQCFSDSPPPMTKSIVVIDKFSCPETNSKPYKACESLPDCVSCLEDADTVCKKYVKTFMLQPILCEKCSRWAQIFICQKDPSLVQPLLIDSNPVTQQPSKDSPSPQAEVDNSNNDGSKQSSDTIDLKSDKSKISDGSTKSVEADDLPLSITKPISENLDMSKSSSSRLKYKGKSDSSKAISGYSVKSDEPKINHHKFNHHKSHAPVQDEKLSWTSESKTKKLKYSKISKDSMDSTGSNAASSISNMDVYGSDSRFPNQSIMTDKEGVETLGKNPRPVEEDATLLDEKSKSSNNNHEVSGDAYPERSDSLRSSDQIQASSGKNLPAQIENLPTHTNVLVVPTDKPLTKNKDLTNTEEKNSSAHESNDVSHSLQSSSETSESGKINTDKPIGSPTSIINKVSVKNDDKQIGASTIENDLKAAMPNRNV